MGLMCGTLQSFCYFRLKKLLPKDLASMRGIKVFLQLRRCVPQMS